MTPKMRPKNHKTTTVMADNLSVHPPRESSLMDEETEVNWGKL